MLSEHDDIGTSSEPPRKPVLDAFNLNFELHTSLPVLDAAAMAGANTCLPHRYGCP
jgi:hypothetical protein